MSNIGDPMAATIPVVGTAGTGYATSIDEFLEEVKDRLEAQVPLSSILVSTLDMQNNPIINAEYLGLYTQTTTPSTPVGTVQYYGGEFYLVTPSGAVQVTSAGALNATSIGGITGNYGGSNPAQFRFVDADETYYAYDDYGLGKWAHIQARDFRITGAATGSPRLALTWTGGSSYTLTLPPALPASTLAMQMDATGAVTLSNDFAGDVTATGNMTADGFYFTTPRTVQIHAAAGTDAAGGTGFANSWQLYNTGTGWTTQYSSTSTGALLFPVNLNEGDTISAWGIYLSKATAASYTAALYKQSAYGALTLVGSTQTTTSSSNITIGQSSMAETMGTNKYVIKVTTTSINSDGCFGGFVTFSRPS